MRTNQSDILHYSESAAKAGEFLRMALPLMGKHNAPVNPVNFAIWYEYVSGRNQPLKDELDQVVEDGKEFTPEFAQDLFRRFVMPFDPASIEEVREQLRQVVVGAMDTIADNQLKAQNASEKLKGFSGELSRDLAIDELRGVVGQILAETRTVSDTGQNLFDRLQDTSGEIEQLRQELETVKQQAATDLLTEVLNRRAFDEGLIGAIREADETGEPLALMLLDVDNFKPVNDTHGHLIGDKVLRTVAALLKRSVKGQDKVARYGGDEFAIILPCTTADGGGSAGENIRQQAEKSRLKRARTGEFIGAVTLSIGVAQYRPGESEADLFRRTDEALYQSKELGRNRVSVAPDGADACAAATH